MASKELFSRIESEAKEKNQSFVLALLDLDDFKEVNDRCGHLQGDRFLREFAQAMAVRLRCTDIVARLGGDEFMVLLFGINREYAVDFLFNLRSELSQKSFRAAVLSQTFTFGTAAYPDDGRSFEALYTVADQRYYAGNLRSRLRGSSCFIGQRDLPDY